MKILLIGNFSPPYEEESLHNLSLLKLLREEGNDCRVINISKSPFHVDGMVHSNNYFDLVFKLLQHGWRKDVIHYLTKSFTRLSLLKFMTSVLITRIFLAKPVVTLHSEMFSIFGQSRSQTGGAQAMYTTFALVHKVICGDKHTFESALRYYNNSDKFEIIPLFMSIPEDMGRLEILPLKKLLNKKKVMVFSHVTSPSLLFDVLMSMLAAPLDPDTGIAVSFSEMSAEKLKFKLAETAGSRLADNLVFIEPDDMLLLSIAYARADLVLRTTICDGEQLYKDFALIARKPELSGDYLYFPASLLIIKEGNVSDLCAHIINSLPAKRDKNVSGLKPADFFRRIKDIYSEKKL